MPRTGAVTFVQRPPVLDGRLDDEAWRGAPLYDGFVQRELREGQPVSERTEVRIVADGEALYIGAWLFDREPGGIVPGEKIRDVSLDNSDYFAIILDTFLDRQNGFVFATTPAGVEYDGQVVKEGEGGGITVTGQTRQQSGSMGGFNLNWDGSWTVRTSSDSAGWYAEFRIPYSTLRYGSSATQSWGLNLSRGIRRKGEDAYWAFIPRQFNLYRLSRAGTLEGLKPPTQRLATITPYILGGSRRDFATDQRMHGTNEFGGDAKYGLTQGLTLDLTYNTDFAQVEVDEQRTNLTRFSLFFPEKRPFFLENAGVFSAGTPQAVELFFTRRIGIDTLGTPVPIRGGGRITGRAAGLTIGALEIVTDESAGLGAQPANSYSVVRAVRELPSRSRIGVLAVERMATKSSADRNGTFALDGRLGAGDAWTFDWWGAKTSTPNRAGDDFGYSVRGAFQTADWNNNARIVSVGSNLNPEVGFLNRTGGYRFYEIAAMRFVRKPEWKWLKDWNPHTNYRGYYGLDGSWQNGQVHIDFTELEFADGGKFGPEINVFHEGLTTPFAIAPNVTLPVGSYNYTVYGLDWTLNPSAPLSFVLRGDFGPFYNGTRNGGNITFTYRQGATLSSSLLFDYNDVRLDQGSFIRQLIGTRLAYFFTPRVFAQTLVQFNNQARVWTANARFGWLGTAGTGLFVVFNEGEEAEGFFRWTRPQTRSVVVKFTRQIGR
ncbi:MAG TPA: DUF5916 domain-containing protein [Gemmatimonadaceae bacterium]|nr:DUF5916 domain-containing protein [Gemmatimonadaceae bacterium]